MQFFYEKKNAETGRMQTQTESRTDGQTDGRRPGQTSPYHDTSRLKKERIKMVMIQFSNVFTDSEMPIPKIISTYGHQSVSLKDDLY